MLLALAAATIFWSPEKAGLYCYHHPAKHDARFKFGCPLPKHVKVTELSPIVTVNGHSAARPTTTDSTDPH